MGDRQARLWHQTLGMSRSRVIRERVDALFMRRMFIPAFEIDADNIDGFIDRIRSHQPVLVDGYAESLNFLAQYVASGRNPGFAPLAMMSSAQELPDHTRIEIEKGFATRVFDKYGSREFSGIAYQCAASVAHHVMDESYIVEILVDGRPARPGEVGEIVVTDLNNYSVPLIRYRIGDLAEAVDDSAPCQCGRSLSRIGRIMGRTQAIVHCADGTWLPGTFFAHFFKDYGHVIRHYQIVQREKGSFTLNLVPHDDYLFTPDLVHRMVEELRRYTGPGTHIEVGLVDEIPIGRTGKRSPVVSSVTTEFQQLGSTGALPTALWRY
jgi:phenylacetate-CoA ligase